MLSPKDKKPTRGKRGRLAKANKGLKEQNIVQKECKLCTGPKQGPTATAVIENLERRNITRNTLVEFITYHKFLVPDNFSNIFSFYLAKAKNHHLNYKSTHPVLWLSGKTKVGKQ